MPASPWSLAWDQFLDLFKGPKTHSLTHHYISPEKNNISGVFYYWRLDQVANPFKVGMTLLWNEVLLVWNILHKDSHKSTGNCLFVAFVFSSVPFLVRKMCHPRQTARGGTDPRPRPMVNSGYLCVCCSCVWWVGVACLCFRTSNLQIRTLSYWGMWLYTFCLLTKTIYRGYGPLVETNTSLNRHFSKLDSSL